MSLFRHQRGNILIMVILISMIAITFFVFLMGYALKNIEQVNNLENSVIASYMAEGAIERSIVEYFGVQEGDPFPTINIQENICTQFTELGEAIIDFFECPTGDYIGILERKSLILIYNN